jgi:hypothetical protein
VTKGRSASHLPVFDDPSGEFGRLAGFADQVHVVALHTSQPAPRSLWKGCGRPVSRGDGLRDRLGTGVVVLFGVSDKVAIVAMVTKDLTGRFHAGKLAQAAAEVVGGKGGGRADMAQAGGSDPAKVDEAMARVLGLLGG